MNTSKTDRIEKQVELRAPRSRVWRALTDAEEFGSWFGVKLQGRFVPGQAIRGKITYPGFENLTLEVVVERIDPETLFSYRWHPYAIDPAVDYSSEPATLVEFRLEEVPQGTRLTVVESGFDKIPAHRREEAFRMNSEGWAEQTRNIERHVAV
ncbi:MAG TPA: SRPBCC family protein [Polyangiaceae bacterium]|nr:SRPBCC family protein [Polyangiaceae bacterium]